MKKRVVSFLLISFLLLPIVTFLTSCQYIDNLLNRKPEVQTFTVTFDSSGGSEVQSITNIESDSLINSPNEPTRENYTFDGWYYNNKLWDFEKDKVSENLTLTAKWTSVYAKFNYGNNKGSKDDPYYIYDDDSFNALLSKYGGKLKPVRQAIQENIDGENINKLDENGYVIYEDIIGETEPNHFKLLSDIDFSEQEYITLFNNGESFCGEIDGNGKTIKNLSINVTTENFEKFIYSNNGYPREYYSNIAIFGKTENALIENISFENIVVDVDNSVISALRENKNDNFQNTYNGKMQEFLVASIIGHARNTTIKANVTAKVNSGAGTVLSSTAGANGVGGVVAYMINSTITSNSEIEKSKMELEIIYDGLYRGFYVGGIAGYLNKSTISNIDSTIKITTNATTKDNIDKNYLYIGGVSGYSKTINIENSIVNLNVLQTETTRLNLSEDEYDSDLYNKVAGIATNVRADDNSQLTKISNVIVNSDIDMDCLFAGVIFEVRTTKYTASSFNLETEDDKNTIFVTLENIIANSNVNSIKVYGIGANLYYTQIKYTEDFGYANYEVSEEKTAKYNLKITGKTEFTTNGDNAAAYILSENSNSNTIHINLKDLYIVYKNNIGFNATDNTRLTFLVGGSTRA